MIELYTWGTPNGQKASIMLEECGLPYEVRPVDIGSGAQHEASYRVINPKGKIPAIVDLEGGTPTIVFESGAILIYLAEKVGRMLAPAGQDRFDALAWTFWQVGGLGPMLGQWLHFERAAPEPMPYAVNRYRTEVERLMGVLDLRLADREHLAGDLSIADVANYPWAAAAVRFLGADEAAPAHANIRRWLDALGSRPAVLAGMKIPELG